MDNGKTDYDDESASLIKSSKDEDVQKNIDPNILIKEDENMKNLIEDKKFILVASFFLGICQNIGFNGIIATLDHHQFYLNKFTTTPPGIFIPMIHFVLATIIITYFIFSKIKFDLKNHLYISAIFLSITFLILPAIFTFGYNFTLIGIIILTCVQGVFLGFLNNSISNIITFFPRDLIGKMSVGQASAELSINLIETLINIILIKNSIESRNLIGCWIIYPFISIIYIIGLYFAYFLFQTEYFKYRENQIHDAQLLKENKEKELLEKAKNEGKKIQHFFLLILYDIWPLVIALFVTNTLVTYSMYPGILLLFNLFGLSYYFKPSIITLLYKIFDVLGRYIGSKYFICRKIYYFLSYGRLIFLPLFFLNAYLDDRINNIYFSIMFVIILICFGISNGICITSFYILTPDQLTDQTLRGKTGTFCILVYELTSGMGTILAFGMLKIIYILAPTKQFLAINNK